MIPKRCVNNLLGYFLYEENELIAEKRGYQILCYNYKHFNFGSNLYPEGSTNIQEQNVNFEGTVI